MVVNVPDDIRQLFDEVKPYLYRGYRFIDDTPQEIKDKFEIVLKWYRDHDESPKYF
ncbi:MAG: hypothetical protein K6F97_01370 [Lachnospiraceae bacterium]|nr:hypothetical protein [Lachnospiraceae bacterium]